MSSHPDADALVRAFLHAPGDETPRLVLADWLDDTGRPQDAAWAAYLRARCTAAHWPDGSHERGVALREAASHARAVTAQLTVGGSHFIRHPHAFLDLLPADRLAVCLAGCVIPPSVLEVIPESVAQTCRVVSISERGRTQFIATPDPTDRNRLQQLEFILNRAVVFVRADAAEIDAVIESQYPETESVTEELFTIPESVALFPVLPPGDDPPVTPMVNTMLAESLRLGAVWLELSPEPDVVRLRYRVADVWVRWDTIPRRLYPAVVARLATMAEIPTGPDRPPSGHGTMRVGTEFALAEFDVLIEPLPVGPLVWIERLSVTYHGRGAPDHGVEGAAGGNGSRGGYAAGTPLD